MELDADKHSNINDLGHFAGLAILMSRAIDGFAPSTDSAAPSTDRSMAQRRRKTRFTERSTVSLLLTVGS